MANVKVTPVRMGFDGEYHFSKNYVAGEMVQVTPQALASGDKYYVDYTDDDAKTLLAFSCSSGTPKITINIGDGIQGVGENLEITLASGKTTPVVIESGRFKKMTGEFKGCVEISTTGAATLLPVMLP